MNTVYVRLIDALGGRDETGTVTVKMKVPKDTLHRGVVAAARLTKEDQESEFLAYVISRASYLNMKLIDFEMEPIRAEEDDENDEEPW